MKNSVMDLEQMQLAADQACRMMKVLANPDRLLILCQLSQGERRVGIQNMIRTEVVQECFCKR